MPREIKLPNGDVKTDERSNRYVPIKTFIWAVGLLLTLIMFFWNAYSFGHTDLLTRVTKVEASHLDIQCQLAGIQKDIIYIREKIDKIDK